MRRSSPAVLAFTFLALFGSPALDARQGEVLTNESILQLVAGKVPRDVIIAKIQQTRNTFNLSPEGLVSLMKAKVAVPAPVLEAMTKASSMAGSAPLTNENVVFMVTNKVPASLIIEKIKVSRTAFDLTTTGLVGLQQSKVPQTIVKAMLTAGPGTAVPPAAPPTASASGRASPAAATSSRSPAARGPTGAAAATGSTASSSASRVADGEPAVLHTPVNIAGTMAKIKEHFVAKNLKVTTNYLTNRVTTDWYDERACATGSLRCATRADIRLKREGPQTTVSVQVFDGTRDGTKAWAQGPKSKGKETSDLANALAVSLAK